MPPRFVAVSSRYNVGSFFFSENVLVSFHGVRMVCSLAADQALSDQFLGLVGAEQFVDVGPIHSQNDQRFI